jgi:hypothetical protein
MVSKMLTEVNNESERNWGNDTVKGIWNGSGNPPEPAAAADDDDVPPTFAAAEED